MKKIILALTLSFITLSTFLHAEDSKILDYNLTTSENTSLYSKLTYKGWNFKGINDKAIFIVIFGHQCPPCLAEMPSFIKAIEEHGDKLSIIAIEAQGLTSAQLQEFKLNHGINYTLLSRNNTENGYFFNDIASKLNWKGQLPLLVTIDKYGELKESQVGKVSHRKIESLIDSLNQ